MGNLGNSIIAVIGFVVAFSIVRAFIHFKAKRAAQRQHAHLEQLRISKAQQPESKNKSRRRRERKAQRK